MSNDVVTVRLSPQHAAFLQANLSALATTTRQAMMRPGMERERRIALGTRAALLETIEDAVHGALLEMPREGANSAERPERRRSLRNLRALSAA